jgi:hypothetical protein
VAGFVPSSGLFCKPNSEPADSPTCAWFEFTVAPLKVPGLQLEERDMVWSVTTVTADLVQNQGTIVLTQSGGTGTQFVNISATFQLSQPNQPWPTNVSRDDLITQAKQLLLDAGNSAAAVKV